MLMSRSLHAAIVPSPPYGHPVLGKAPPARLAEILGGPKIDEAGAEVFAEIEAERKADFGRVIDLQADA
jgi:hypothetical protein